MLETIYYKEEVIPLVFRMALELFGHEKGAPEEIFEKHKKMILDLLKDKQTTSREIASGENSEYDWTEKVAKRFWDQMTQIQKSIIKTLINGNGEAAIEELGNGIRESDLPWTNNKTIGGALAGLTRKCKNQRIPSIFIWKDEKYLINRDAESYMKKYI